MFPVKLFGFACDVGYIAAGKEANLLLKQWFRMMFGIAVLVTAGAAILILGNYAAFITD
ncbi:hypothetical protein [Mesorhizobium sp. M0496]|uniref:hypothetical protein n=1 Tax=Mesorhizobium sp. M0496 TaxID=2956952 RepID=UPI00333AA9D4